MRISGVRAAAPALVFGFAATLAIPQIASGGDVDGGVFEGELDRLVTATQNFSASQPAARSLRKALIGPDPTPPCTYNFHRAGEDFGHYMATLSCNEVGYCADRCAEYVNAVLAGHPECGRGADGFIQGNGQCFYSCRGTYEAEKPWTHNVLCSGLKKLGDFFFG